MSPRAVKIALGVTAAVASAAILIASWALYARFEQTNQNRSANKMVWHAVICQIEIATTKNKKLTPLQKEAQLRFFDRLLIKDVQTQGCGLVHG